MREFLIFYSGNNDQMAVVWNYHNRAEARAQAIGKDVDIKEVDVDTASDEDKKHWNGRETIECVTVCEGGKRKVGPSNADVDEMIDDV